MADSRGDGLAPETSPRRRRWQLPPPVRHLVVALLGALLAVATSYALRRLGY